MNQRTAPRLILHLDMDAFYASIEAREDPSLAGKPLIIGHRGPRGVVATCSYEARRFGVHSAMPSVRAERLCPQAIWLPGRMDLYVEVSSRIRALLESFTPCIEPLSIDEAFLDLTGIGTDLESGAGIARRIKARIRAEERLTASAGVAPNKFLAKVASDLEKPDGLVVLALEAVPERLWPLPIERLWGVGPKTAARLRAGGIRSIGEVAAASGAKLESLVGATLAAHLGALARGVDERPVETERETKSMSEERTYQHDLVDPDAIDRALLERAEGVARALRAAGLVGRSVEIKVRAGDFTTWTRVRTLSGPTDLAEVVVQAARQLFRERIRLEGKGVRLLGVGVGGLEPASGSRGASGAQQPSLFPDASAARSERLRTLARTTDDLRDKLGRDAVVRARLLRPRREREEDEGGAAPPEASTPPSVD